MKQIKLAALVAAIVITFSGCILAQTPDAQREQQVGTVGSVAAPVTENPPDSSINCEVIRGQRGDTGPQGPQGLSGFNGSPGRPGRRGVRGLRGLRGPAGRAGRDLHPEGVYREVKRWDPASCSYVDAKDQVILGKAKAYANGLVDGANSTRKHIGITGTDKWDNVVVIDKTPAHHDWSWLWWLLPIMIIFLFLSWLLSWPCHYWHHYVWMPFWSARHQPELEPNPEPDMIITNAAGGTCHNIKQEDAVVKIVSTGKSCVRIAKGFATSPTATWRYVKAGESVQIPTDVGTPLRFVIAISTTASFPTSTDMVHPKDEFLCHIDVPYKVVKGSFFLGNQKLRDLDPEELKMITSGEEFELRQFIDAIPPDKSVSFIYQVDIVTPEQQGAVPGPDGQPMADSEFKLADLLALDKKAVEPKPEPIHVEVKEAVAEQATKTEPVKDEVPAGTFAGTFAEAQAATTEVLRKAAEKIEKDAQVKEEIQTHVVEDEAEAEELGVEVGDEVVEEKPAKPATKPATKKVAKTVTESKPETKPVKKDLSSRVVAPPD